MQSKILSMHAKNTSIFLSDYSNWLSISIIFCCYSLWNRECSILLRHSVSIGCVFACDSVLAKHTLPGSNCRFHCSLMPINRERNFSLLHTLFSKNYSDFFSIPQNKILLFDLLLFNHKTTTLLKIWILLGIFSLYQKKYLPTYLTNWISIC